MAKQFESFSDAHCEFIAAQSVYFVATTAPDARINLSPKGMESLRVTGPNALIWLNVTGSGNETAAHLPIDPRMTVMWCSFGQRPLILRAYGTAVIHHQDSPRWAELAPVLPQIPGARQIIEMTVDLVQTSCGYAVPTMENAQERPVLRNWASDQGDQGLRAYWDTRNRTSIDDLPTGIEANLLTKATE